MKVAIGFFGIPRHSTTCWPSIQEMILSAAPSQAEVQGFFHFYRQSRVVSSRSGEDVELGEENYAAFAGCEGELEEPEVCLQQWRFDALQSFGDAYDDGWGSLRNLVHQLNSLHRLTERIAAWGPDCVAFVRPDLLYHDRWETEAFRLCCESPKLALIPDWQPWGGENDRFALCGREAMTAYGRRLEQAVDYCRAGPRPLRAEPLLAFSLRRSGVAIRHRSWRASRVRTGGRVIEESFRRERPRSMMTRALGTLRGVARRLGLR